MLVLTSIDCVVPALFCVLWLLPAETISSSNSAFYLQPFNDVL